MKKLFFLMSLFAYFNVNAQEKVLINDSFAVVRDVGSFDVLEINGPFKVYYSVGAKYRVAVSANSENARDRIRVIHSDGALKIDIKDSYKTWFSSGTRYKIYISSPTIRNISASGAVDFFVTDLLKSDALKIKFTGASDFLGKVDCKELQLNLTGASDAELTGNVTQMNASLTGASKLNASTLNVENADIKVTGASEATVKVQKSMHAIASGASHVYYYGNPMSITAKSSGASKIKRRG